jgi:hypothetical protein
VILARRIISTLLIFGALGGVIAVDRHKSNNPVGASSALVNFAGFPQVSEGTRISTSWFCPGVAAGDGISSGSIVIVNPGETDVTASVSFLSDSPAEVQNVVVAARSRQVVDLLRGRSVGVVVPVVEIIGSVGTVEQELDYAAGDVTSQCVSQTSSSWFFADGFTAEGSSHRLVLTNPFPESAVVNVAFTTTAGRRTPSALQGIILAPRSARSVSLADAGAQDESRIAVEVVATTGQIIASRIQHYLGLGRLGYSTTVGTPTALNEWWFTSGRTGAQSSEQLVVFNPSDRASQVNVSFFGDKITTGVDAGQSNAAAPSSVLDIPAGAIVSINTDTIADLPKGDHAMVISSVNNVPVVVEHVLSQTVNNGSFTAITNGIPSGLLTQIWRIPSGLANGALNALSVLNTTAGDGTFTVSALGPGGQVALPELVDVPLTAAALVSLNVPAGVNDGEIVITATVPIAVQRRTARGHGLAGFGIVSGLPVRPR